MNYKKLKQILLEHYTLDSAKHMLKLKNPNKPSYKMAEILYLRHKIPFEAWLDIRGWISEQEAKEELKQEKERAKK
ncbi:hypothetical protein [Campylobacter iguaniorum]|uniref:hypothetical protein n=1 Tax=Campylobacter iguaniorum TaxID=1244531 RepID=UPI00073A3691|nr:hypothetical protein [Campylobacter iguaniorum]